jgi:RNA polymerase sigma factor (TIGR02999 family)
MTRSELQIGKITVTRQPSMGNQGLSEEQVQAPPADQRPIVASLRPSSDDTHSQTTNSKTIEITQLITAIDTGEVRVAEELLPLVYDELRRLAAQLLARETPGQTLQPTALVHDAWLRLAGGQPRGWNGQKHFFAAAAKAMRRILIDNARHKARLKHGGGMDRVELEGPSIASPMVPEELLSLDEALDRFAREEPEAARLVELRYFAGLSHQEAAALLGISRRTADGLWAYARAWLRNEMRHEPGETKAPASGPVPQAST